MLSESLSRFVCTSRIQMLGSGFNFTFFRAASFSDLIMVWFLMDNNYSLLPINCLYSLFFSVSDSSRLIVFSISFSRDLCLTEIILMQT